MKYLEKLATLKVFTKSDINELTNNINISNYIINKYLRTTSDLEVLTIDGIKVTSIERALVD